MNLSLALKKKNRLIRELEDKKKLLQTNNVKINDNEPEYDAEELKAGIDKLIDDLVTMKSAISLANGPIQDKIYKISELKGLIKVYEALDTKHGSFTETIGYGDAAETSEFTATIRRRAADGIMRGLQEQIDGLQDEIDGHNHNTTI